MDLALPIPPASCSAPLAATHPPRLYPGGGTENLPRGGRARARGVGLLRRGVRQLGLYPVYALKRV
jgi:hypothetical protein